MAGVNRRPEGKRVVKKSSRAPVGLIVVLCAVAAVAALYLGLCVWAGGHILPNSSAAGVELGGLSHAAAEKQMQQAAQEFRDKTVNLTCGGVSIPCELGKAGLSWDSAQVLSQLSSEGSFFTRGAAWLRALGGERSVDEGALRFEDQLYMDGLITELTSAMSNPVEQHSVAVGETEIRITAGHAGQSIDTTTVEAVLCERIANGRDYSDLALEAVVTQPDALDLESLHAEIYVEPMNAALNGETFEITPSVTGVSFDIPTAQALFERAEAGETVVVPLVFTQPEVTTELMEASLFANVLGEAKSTVSGSAARKSNVKLACSMVTETILLPGEEFSYWSMITPCSKEQGFQDAPTYVNGETVPGVGGGVCQVSSSIYTATLYANLEIVQRNQHTYAVGYLPDGNDAMVNGGSSDFKFRNSTEWPIKIVAGVEGSKLTVQILGTKTDDTYVKLEFVELSSNPYETIYQIDNSVPAGTPKEKTSGYRGRKTETYRCIYDGNGNLIGRTLENKNSYARRDRILLINSADAAKYNVDPVSGAKLPESQVTPAPAVSATPAVSTTPVPETTPAPSAEPTPEVTPPADLPTMGQLPVMQTGDITQ